MARKCAQAPEVFSEICLASRTIQKCEKIKNQINEQRDTSNETRTNKFVHATRNQHIEIAQVDADNRNDVINLIGCFKPDILINVALPYQDISIMEACLETGVDYLDTANYEPPDDPKFCYKWQWDFHDRFKEKGIMALLGCGFDPGVTNIFCAHARKEHLDEIHYIDILDCNAGDHGYAFATNFNPEINIREVTAKGKFYENGEWKETEPLSVHKTFDFPGIGSKEAYLMYHEELESLVKNIPEMKRIRFWMTFSDSYLNHLKVLQNVGMTRIDPVEFEGNKIVPLKFLKAVLPNPASLGENYKGKTCIGCLVRGIKDGKKKKIYIYNISDHEKCYKEVNAQAISYTTGVPAMIGAMLMLTNIWRGNGVFNVEEFDPSPFMEKLNIHGLPWVEKEL